MELFENNLLIVPPHNTEAEQSTLGSMMIDKIALAKGLEILSAGDFYRPSHQWVFDALKTLYTSDVPADLITLQEELRKRNKLEDAGGTEYLMALVDTVPTSANIEHYAKIVIRDSLLRQQQVIGMQIQSRIASGEASPAEINDFVSGQIDQLNMNRGCGLVMVKDELMSHYEEISSRKGKVGVSGYTSGFSRFDNHTGGLGQPMFVLLRADRGQGKTHLAIQVSVNCLRSGKAVVFVSLDTPKRLMLNRYIAHLTGINSFRINNPNDSDWDAIAQANAWLWQQPLFFEWEAGITVRQIAAKCNAVKNAGYEIGLVVIDYAEMLGYSEKRTNHEQELSEVANGLKNLRDQMGVTILLLTQVNADGQERWSRSLGNQADVVTTWTKDKSEKNGKGIGKWYCEKNRLASGFSIDCFYDAGTSRIRELQLDYSDPSYPPSWPWWFDPENDDQQHELEDAPSYPVEGVSGYKPKEEEE